MNESPSRSPALKKDIDDITDEDSRVQIIGTILEYVPGIIGDSSSLSQLIITDGTGNIKVFVDEYIDRDFKTQDKIRVFAKVIANNENSFDLNAEIIQDMNELDVNLYNFVRKYRTENKK
jgi:RPA family protein